MLVLSYIFCFAVQIFFGADATAQEAAAKYESKALKKVGVDEKLGDALDLELEFMDEAGGNVALGSVFSDGKPVLMTLNYYSCETLCSAQLNALLSGLKKLDWKPGKEFKILTVSIDPEETSDLARKKRKSYLEELGYPQAEWHFWVGRASQIKALADSVGFRYAYDPIAKQYAHPAVISFISTKGIVSRYLYGIQYVPRDIKFSLMETAEGRVGSVVDKVIMSCFSYDYSLGKYTPAAFGLMRLGGVLSLLVIAIFSMVMWRRELRRSDHLKGSV